MRGLKCHALLGGVLRCGSSQSESPWPQRSTAIVVKKDSLRRSVIGRHTRRELPKPWISSSGGPSPVTVATKAVTPNRSSHCDLSNRAGLVGDNHGTQVCAGGY